MAWSVFRMDARALQAVNFFLTAVASRRVTAFISSIVGFSPMLVAVAPQAVVVAGERTGFSIPSLASSPVVLYTRNVFRYRLPESSSLRRIKRSAQENLSQSILIPKSCTALPYLA